MNTKKVEADFQCIGHSITSLEVKNELLELRDDENTSKTFQLSHELGEIEVLEGTEKKCGLLQLHIDATVEEDEKEFALKLAIQGCFVVPQQLPDAQFSVLLAQNGLAMLYAAARAIVTSISAQVLTGGSVILPMINVVKYSKELDPKEKQ